MESGFDPTLWILGLFPVVFVAFWCFVCLLLSVIGGWRSLASAYPGREPTPHATVLTWVSGRLGLTNYNNVLRLGVDSMHLHLGVLKIFAIGHPPVSIPWSDVSAAPARRFLMSGVELTFHRAPKAKLFLRERDAARLNEASGGRLGASGLEVA